MSKATVIETTGESVGETIPAPPIEEKKTPIDAKDVPIYTVARAVEWLKRPENAQRIEQAAKRAGEVQRDLVGRIDSEVSKVGRLLVELGTDDDILEDFTNSFLKSLIGED